MTDYLELANEEIKRADHLVYVSLKYTRTCDVIKHVVERLIASIDYLLSHILQHLEQNGDLDAIPSAPIQRCKKIKELFPDDEQLQDAVSLCLKLRKVVKAEFSRSCEFRRHVTLTVTLLDDEIVQLNIDNVTEYFKQVKDLREHLDKLLGVEDD